MVNKTVLVDKVPLQAGMSRKTHFFVINKEMQVVAIERTPELIQNAMKTRKAKTIERKKVQAKRQEVAMQKAKRKELIQEAKTLREEHKKNMERLRKEARLQKELLESKLKRVKKSK